MTETETKNIEEMKRYLFHETSDDERGALEERFFADDDLFFELVDLENDLVDRYARNELKADERARFERSLSVLPDRREKVANAAALQKFIVEENQPAIMPARNIAEEKQIVRRNVFNLFGFRMPVLQLAGAAMMILLTVGVGYLLYERARINEELARLRGSEQSGRVSELEQRENALQEQVKQSNEREQNLQNQITNERGQSDILDSELERERSEKSRLEREIEILRKQKTNLPPVEPQEIEPPAPIIAAIILSPASNSRGVAGNNVKTIKVDANTAKIAATLQIPKESTGENFSIKLEGAPLAENIKPQKTRQGSKFISVAIPAQKLSLDKENLLTVTGDDASRYNYIFRPQK